MRSLRNAIGIEETPVALGAPLMGGVWFPVFYRYYANFARQRAAGFVSPLWEDWTEDPDPCPSDCPSDWETVATAIGPDTMPTCAIGHYGDLGVVRGVIPVPQLLSEHGVLVLLPTHPDSTTSILEPDTIAGCLEQIAAYIRAGGLLPSLVDGIEGGA